MDTEITNLKQYLLGRLGEEETREIDLRVLSDASLDEKLSFAEHELIEDFLDGELSPDEAQSFSDQFLTSEERRALVRQIVSLRRHALGQGTGVAAASAKPAKAGVLKRVKGILRHGYGALLAVGMAGILGLIWLSGSFGPERRAFRKLNKGDLTRLEDFAQFSKVRLAPVAPQISGLVETFAQTSFTETVLFRLRLPIAAEAEIKFKIQIMKNGRKMMKLDRVSNYAKNGGRELRVLMPAATLGPGTYQIRAASFGEASNDLVYDFLVSA